MCIDKRVWRFFYNLPMLFLAKTRQLLANTAFSEANVQGFCSNVGQKQGLRHELIKGNPFVQVVHGLNFRVH